MNNFNDLRPPLEFEDIAFVDSIIKWLNDYRCYPVSNKDLIPCFFCGKSIYESAGRFSINGTFVKAGMLFVMDDALGPFDVVFNSRLCNTITRSFEEFKPSKISASPSIAIISRLVNAFSFDKGREGEDFLEQSSALNEAQAFLDEMNVEK